MMAVLIAAIFTTACSKYKYETIPNDPLKTRVYTLDNGLKVYMSVMKEQPRIQTYIAVRVGGKNDPKETTGLAHYFEHLMFKGTPNFGTSNYEAEKPLLDEIERLFEVYRKTTDEKERAAIYHRIDSVSYEASKYSIPNEYDKLMSIIGAQGTNAYTSQDATVYVEDIPSNQIDNWARIQADRFRTPVIRGFHTELETIYEEKNMSLTKDSRKVLAAMDEALFPHHPYGTQTVLGTQEHLKNPSITNVKAYHKTYYVPNNVAICVSGDFDPEQMIQTIDKYFGDMTPNKDLPKLKFEAEAPITAPVEKEVFGPEAANLAISWRLPKIADKSNDKATLAAYILSNGSAGLIDLDLNKEQKLLYAYAFTYLQPDYGRFMMGAAPKEGQTLEEVRDLLLAEVEKLRKGEFDEKLIEATINNIKVEQIKNFDSYSQRADFYVNNFINGSDLNDDIHQLERLEKITKQDIIDWANEYLKAEAYAVVYKRQGVDPNEQKIAAPKITPIIMNRDKQSDFLKEIQANEVKPIEPVFVDFDKEMEVFDLRDGIRVLYKQNTDNDLFKLSYSYNIGREDCPALPYAENYLEYLDTKLMNAEERGREIYDKALSIWGLSVGSNRTGINFSGLSEHMGRAIEIVEDLYMGTAVANEQILENVKADVFKSRMDSKHNQASCFGALRTYLAYGPEYIRKSTLSNEQVKALTSEELLAAVKALKGMQHEICYYGPLSKEELIAQLNQYHKTVAELRPLEVKYRDMQPTDQPKVLLAQYDAKQLYYLQACNYGTQFDVRNSADILLYNTYFAGDMSSIVFQEMREARGLAYTAQAVLTEPYHKTGNYGYLAFIATQNDKMQRAIEGFDEIINNMPESQPAFDIAQKGILNRLRTQRTVKDGVLNRFMALRELGLKEDPDKAIFEQVQNMTLEDVKATQEKWVKDRHYVYGILGDIKDLDLNYLKTLGPIQTVSSEEIFGF